MYLRSAILTEILSELIEKLDTNQKNKLSKKAYYNELATFSINLGRRSGHSTIAKELLKRYDNSIVFTYNLSNVKSNFKDYEKQNRVFSFKSKKYQGIDFKDKIIIMDIASFVKKDLIDMLMVFDPKCFILLG